jgi:hypothetical protein
MGYFHPPNKKNPMQIAWGDKMTASLKIFVRITYAK